MKKINMNLLSIALIFLIASCGQPESQNSDRMPNFPFEETELEHVPLEKAIQLATETNKKVLIDVYTDWCGYCRKMANEVYPTKAVQDAIEEYFIYVRLDAESSERVNYNGHNLSKQQLAAEFGVTGFPTTVFLSEDGSPLGSQPGFMEAAMFSKLLVYVGSDAYTHTPFDQFTIE